MTSSRDGNRLAPEETIDEILGGKLRIIQKKAGYRFCIDSLLLAHFAMPRDGEDLIDLGTGSGVIALILASRHALGRVVGIEIQEELVAMARRSAAINGLEGRVEIRRGDIRRPEAIGEPLSFDAALFNPPYRRLRSGRMNPDPAKAMARHEVAGTLGDFLAASSYLLREKGRAAMIYPAVRMAELITRMRTCRIEPKRMRIVHSRPGSRGEFILLEGVKGGREGLAVGPPLFIYGPGRAYSDEVASLFIDLSASDARGGGRSPSA